LPKHELTNIFLHLRRRQIQETKTCIERTHELVYTIITGSDIAVYKIPIRLKDGIAQIFIQGEDWIKIKDDDLIPLAEGFPKEHDYGQCKVELKVPAPEVETNVPPNSGKLRSLAS
jgi:hypothetical protein